MDAEQSQGQLAVTGERLTIAETLAAKPAYRRRLAEVSEFLAASRRRGDRASHRRGARAAGRASTRRVKGRPPPKRSPPNNNVRRRRHRPIPQDFARAADSFLPSPRRCWPSR